PPAPRRWSTPRIVISPKNASTCCIISSVISVGRWLARALAKFTKMYEHIVDLETALDGALPRPRLRGRPSPQLIDGARDWAEAAEWERFMACEWCRRLANPINQPPYWSIGRTTGVYSPSVAFMRAVETWWSVLRDTLSANVSAWPLAVVALAYASYANEGAI